MLNKELYFDSFIPSEKYVTILLNLSLEGLLGVLLELEKLKQLFKPASSPRTTKAFVPYKIEYFGKRSLDRHCCEPQKQKHKVKIIKDT